MANYLGEYYATNGEKLAKAFITDNLPFDISEAQKEANFTFQFVPLEIVEKYIQGIEICKASGIANLSSLLLKDAFRVISVELTHIINGSIRTATFPDAWAIGSITPIPKEGDVLDPGNWRPLSILPLPSKLLEKAVHFQMSAHLDNNGYLAFNQHGFRKGKCTSTAILELASVLTDNYKSTNHTSFVFVDYKKAFETLDHNILLGKLAKYNFDQNSIKWLQSYIGNRRHVVKCSGTFSKEIKVKYGVPQGSVLGPLCFIINVNDLITNIKRDTHAEIIMYTDDTVLLMKNKDLITGVQEMQEILDYISRWCVRNKLTVNAKKTKHMLVLRNKDLINTVEALSVNFAGAMLGNVPTYKYLGVDLDRNLTYENAVHNTYVKANKKLFTLHKIRPYISQSTAALINQQFILPILDHADFLFESTVKRELEMLDKVQTRAVRLI